MDRTNFMIFKIQATSTALFTIALLAYFGRTVVRYRHQKLLLDDVFLFLGVLCLCAAFGLLVKFAEITYTLLGPHVGVWYISPNYESRMMQWSKISYAYFSLTYSLLFSVKLSFLFFVRILVRRVHKMTIYWWTILAIMLIAWPVTIFAPSCGVLGTSSSTTGFFKGPPLFYEANRYLSQQLA